ncbi:unnamed protein product [Closterium sp. Naga37s-1]|nr:unnamed protein product [Closterium sp. Naga37s-1]
MAAQAFPQQQWGAEGATSGAATAAAVGGGGGAGRAAGGGAAGESAFLSAPHTHWKPIDGQFPLEFAYERLLGVGSCSEAPLADSSRSPTRYPTNCPSLDESCIQETDFQPHPKWAAQVEAQRRVIVVSGPA